ncbi:MAG: 1-deoxy-D-xylulose-5-phosphate synthase [Ruminiclostridium sp.]
MILNDDISPEKLKSLSLAEKKQLCSEIRSFLIEVISGTGGHLASNLGTVELTVALHSVFTTPYDKIVFDVGHQAYTHKILTGRKVRFNTLRTENGISGFPRPSESVHDAFIGGHSSISISAALGISKAMELNGDNHKVVAVIGDGALTGGEAYEALNNASKIGKNLIIVLNDNEMSISKNSGAIASYLTQMRSSRKYYDTKNKVKEILNRTTFGKELAKPVSVTKDLVKFAIYQSNIFENLGFKYLGPVDGHDIAELTEVFEVAKLMNEPCIVHVKTKKGKGYKPAEENSGQYHGVDKKSGTGSKGLTYSEAFGRELLKIAGNDSKICAVTAAMKYGTGLNFFAKKYPERFFDVGIAEEHALTFACGLASQGMIPVFAVYSTFLQRCYDQIIHDAAIENLHIVLAVDRAGFVGEDGETHQGIFDAAMLSTIPNVTIYSPADANEVRKCVHKAIYETTGIAVVRYPKGVEQVPSAEEAVPECKIYEQNSKTLVCSYGRITMNAKQLIADKTDVLQLIKVYPIPDEIMPKLLKYERIFFFEEGIKQGGIGEKLLVKLNEYGYKGFYNVIAVDSEFVRFAEVESQLKKYKLDSESMREIVLGEGIE